MRNFLHWPKISQKRDLESVLKKSLQDILKMSWRSFCKTSWKRLENVLKTSWRCMAKTNIMVLIRASWRRLEDIFWRRMSKANIFVLIKTSWRHFEDVLWRRRWKTSSRRRKTSSRCLHQERMFAGYSSATLFFVLSPSSIFCKALYFSIIEMFTLFIFYTCSGTLRCLWKIRIFVIINIRILIHSNFSEVCHWIADITKKRFVCFVTKFWKEKWI